jgi:hypothetical protein
MPVVVLNWLTAADVTSSIVAKQFFAYMEAHLPNQLPSVCGSVEPLSIPFFDRDRICSLWGDDLYWQGRLGRRKGDSGVEGNISNGKFWHSWIRHRYQTRDTNEDDVCGFLRETSELFKADYSYAHVFGDSKPSPEDELLLGLVSHELQTCLPTIPWICCFGVPYLKMLGREHIASAPFSNIQDIDSGLLFCQTVQDASDCFTTQFLALRELIKSAIGKDYFFDPTCPQKKAIVPSFTFLRNRN